MIVKPLTLHGAIETNAYFYIDEKTSHGFLIDPAAEPQKLLDLITENHWTIEKILLTHGHFDHIGAVADLHEKLGIPYFIHEQGKIYLTNPNYNLSAYFGEDITLTQADFLKEDALITLENNACTLKLLHTPGHTLDSSIFYDKVNQLAFVGDTIFKASIGRTDFPGGNLQTLKESIYHKIMTLPPETILYSGHSAPTTIAAEKPNIAFFF